MKLVKFQKDWADEFYVYGFQVFTDEAWDAFKSVIENAPGFSLYFGTNEAWEWGDYEPQDVLSSDIEVTEITDEEAAIIQKLFGTQSYGVFPDKECFEEQEW